MLSYLSIKNIVTAQELKVEFSGGLNVLTGETGAGKSVILKSLELISGKKAGVDLIRTGSNSAEVEALIHQENGEELVVKRILDRTGRGRCFLNGSLVSTGELLNRFENIFDFTSQHSTISLLSESSHISYLDSFGVSSDLLNEVANNYQRLKDIEKDIFEITKRLEVASSNEIYEKEIIESLTKLAPKFGEKEEIEAELNSSNNEEQIKKIGDNLLELLDSSLIGLNEGVSLIGKLKDIDENFSEEHKNYTSAYIELKELSRSLDKNLRKLSVDESRIEFLRARYTEIMRGERRYSKGWDELATFLEELNSKKGGLGNIELDLIKLKKELVESEKSLKILEQKLTKERKSLALELSKAVNKILPELVLDKGKFEVEVETGKRTKNGVDIVKFLFSPNPGSELKSIAKAASGGELSRLMLAIKCIFNEKNSIYRDDIQIFDEIDSGISGIAAQAVGEKLFKISRTSQVILVTHTPQIAALADRHIFIEKSTDGEQTYTAAKELDLNGRIEVIAGMLAGKDQSKSFLQSAKSLIQRKENLNA